jgi:hypothetical protein
MSITLAPSADGTSANLQIGGVTKVTIDSQGISVGVANRSNDFTAQQKASPITDNDLNFSLTAGNNFNCTFTGAGTLTFTGMASAAGQSGWIKIVQSGNGTVSAAANTKITSTNLSRLGYAGTYICSYYCDGTDVYVSIGTFA